MWNYPENGNFSINLHCKWIIQLPFRWKCKYNYNNIKLCNAANVAPRVLFVSLLESWYDTSRKDVAQWHTSCIICHWARQVVVRKSQGSNYRISCQYLWTCRPLQRQPSYTSIIDRCMCSYPMCTYNISIIVIANSNECHRATQSIIDIQ